MSFHALLLCCCINISYVMVCATLVMSDNITVIYSLASNQVQTAALVHIEIYNDKLAKPGEVDLVLYMHYNLIFLLMQSHCHCCLHSSESFILCPLKS